MALRPFENQADSGLRSVAETTASSSKYMKQRRMITHCLGLMEYSLGVELSRINRVYRPKVMRHACSSS